MNRFSLIFSSISTRLTLLFVLMAVIFIVFVGSAIGYTFKANFHEYIRPHLVQYLEYTQEEIGSPPSVEKAKAIAQKLPIDIYIKSDSIDWSSTGTTLDLESINFHRNFHENNFDYSVGETSKQLFLVLRHPDYRLIFAVDHSHKQWHWHRLLPLLVLLLILLIGYFVIRRLFGPLSTIQTGIQKIGKGDLNYTIEVKRKDELGQLANSINSMTNEIKQMLDAKRQLLLAISHELRSPLTRAKVATELLANQEQKDSINYDLGVMQHLIDELLETERLNNNHSVLNKSPIDLNPFITNFVSDNYDSKVDYELPTNTITISVDEVRIKLLLNNLIDNAIKYNLHSEKLPLISITTHPDKLEISVIDYGKGVEPSQLSHLTEPFYRVDPARQHETGGYGLGLYLCKIIAEAHGGQLSIQSEIGQGTKVMVTLPVD